MPLVLVLQRVLARRDIGSLLVTLAICLVAGALAGALVAFATPLYAAALVVGVAAALLMLRSPDFTLMVTVAVIYLLPFGTLPLNVGFSPTFLNLALGMLFLVWAARIATGRQGRWVSSPISAFVAIFALATVGAFAAGLGHAQLTATALRQFAEIPLGIMIFFAVLNLVRTRRQVQQLTTWLILGGALAGAIGIVLYFLPPATSTRLLSALGIFRYPSGPDVLRYIEDDPSLPQRAISTSVDPNVLGALMALTLGLATPHLFERRPFIPRLWLLAAAASAGVCLFLTYSRGSLAGLAVGVIAILSLIGRYRKALLALALVALLLLLLPQTQAYVAHFEQGVQGQDRATQMRFGEYKDALILIQRYPWLGVGFVDAPDIDLYVGVSNLYLMITEETGVIGLAAYLVTLALFYIITWIAWRHGRADPTLAPWIIGPAVSITAGLAGGVFDHTLFSFSHMLTLFWLIIGLGIVTAKLVEGAAEGARKVRDA